MTEPEYYEIAFRAGEEEVNDWDEGVPSGWELPTNIDTGPSPYWILLLFNLAVLAVILYLAFWK